MEVTIPIEGEKKILYEQSHKIIFLKSQNVKPKQNKMLTLVGFKLDFVPRVFV